MTWSRGEELTPFVTADCAIAATEKQLALAEKLLQNGPDNPEEKVRITALRNDLSEQITTLYRKERDALDIYQLARHPERPHTKDYLFANLLDGQFNELHGDRTVTDDQAMIGGIGVIAGQQWMIVGHQKGRTAVELGKHNFGSAKAAGYRKATRLMTMAGKFKRPILCLIDTPAAEGRPEFEFEGISRAIAETMTTMSALPVPIVAVIIGEGGSGGAIGIGVGNRVLMLEHSIYSIIPPPACASILYKTGITAQGAANALKITPTDNLRAGFIDRIIAEPPGAAHRNLSEMTIRIRAAVIEEYNALSRLSANELIEQRYQRFRAFGAYYKEEGTD